MRLKIIPVIIVAFVIFFLVTNPVGAAAMVGEFLDLVSRFFEALIVFFDYLL